MQSVFDSDPPFVAGAGENGYDESIATIKRPLLVRPIKKEILGLNVWLIRRAGPHAMGN
jgi:hypothetical protein